MKNIQFIITLTALLLFGAACTKFVAYDPQEDYQITANDYLKTADDFNKMAIGVTKVLLLCPITKIDNENVDTRKRNINGFDSGLHSITSDTSLLHS